MKQGNKVCKTLQSLMLTVLFFSSIHIVLAQDTSTIVPDLYFYGAESHAGDESIIQLTQDLFYSHLFELDLFAIQDRRGTVFSFDILKTHDNNKNILFYAEIYEEDGQWISILHLIDTETQKEATLKNSYDGYYKILIEAKNSLSTLIEKFNSNISTPINQGESSTTISSVSGDPITAELLSGTWKGETYIDKIVMLRGGRGFIFFENGASMNITISVDGSTLIARQESKSNASFLPHLPREVALAHAIDAEPIVWELSIENENSLSGVKHIPVTEYDSDKNISVIQGSIPVEWSR